MSVKFKLGFTVSAETLFTLLSKMLPIDDLSVEEVVEPPPVPAHMDSLDRYMKPPKLIKPQLKTVRRRGRNALNPNKGVNKIILDMLADGKPHHVAEADGSIKEAGYSPNGMYSRIQRLQRHGLVFQPRKGLWQLTPKSKEQ